MSAPAAKGDAPDAALAAGEPGPVGLKDFAPGQEAAVMEMCGGEPRPCRVLSVGRKYVRVQEAGSYSVQEYIQEDWCQTSLILKRDWGERSHLFPSMRQALMQKEKQELIKRLRHATGVLVGMGNKQLGNMPAGGLAAAVGAMERLAGIARGEVQA